MTGLVLHGLLRDLLCGGQRGRPPRAARSGERHRGDAERAGASRTARAAIGFEQLLAGDVEDGAVIVVDAAQGEITVSYKNPG